MTEQPIENVHQQCIDRVCSYIQQNIHQNLNREILADVAAYSVPHFHRVFTACMGESAINYVRRMRLNRAGRKLRMGAVDITAVALAAGYESHAAFGKAFKKQFGLSPSDFRELTCFEATDLLRRHLHHENHSD